MANKNNYTDLSGNKYGRLLVLSRANDRISKSGKKCIYYLCLCDCGNKKEIGRWGMVAKTISSCGCLRKEITELKKINANPDRTKNGKVTTEYKIWQGMQQRCYNTKDKGYSKYGAKGIAVCDRWRESFNNFLEDMGKRPSLKHSLDRYPNQKGNYEKSNCRWATDLEQACNREGIVWIEYNGMKKVKKHWALHFGLSKGGLDWHLQKGRTLGEIYEILLKKGKIK